MWDEDFWYCYEVREISLKCGILFIYYLEMLRFNFEWWYCEKNEEKKINDEKERLS